MPEGIPLNGSHPQGEDETFLVPPMLVPAAYRFRQIRGSDGSLAMALEIHSPTGVCVTFWPGESAEQFGAEMLKVGRATKAGLELPAHKMNPGM